jgi:hypothetical protein
MPEGLRAHSLWFCGFPKELGRLWILRCTASDLVCYDQRLSGYVGVQQLDHATLDLQHSFADIFGC